MLFYTVMPEQILMKLTKHGLTKSVSKKIEMVWSPSAFKALDGDSDIHCPQAMGYSFPVAQGSAPEESRTEPTGHFDNRGSLSNREACNRVQLYRRQNTWPEFFSRYFMFPRSITTAKRPRCIKKLKVNERWRNETWSAYQPLGKWKLLYVVLQLFQEDYTVFYINH